MSENNMTTAERSAQITALLDERIEAADKNLNARVRVIDEKLRALTTSANLPNQRAERRVTNAPEKRA
jgi:hypothetical protein